MDYVDLTLERGIKMSGAEADMTLQTKLRDRVMSLASEQSSFAEWCRRADALYYSTTFTQWGADLWAADESATTPGRTHVSVNSPSAYVDIPSSLQAVQPIENMLAREDSDEGRSAAQAMERVYKAWKGEEDFELKFHKVTTIKALYGRTAGMVYWDPDEGRPCASVIQNPRNLYLGYKSDDYEKVEWAAYVSKVDPNSITEDYGVDVTLRRTGEASVASFEGTYVPWVSGPTIADQPRPELNFGPARIDVWDYWYRKPADRQPRTGPRKMETWNVVIAGNAVVRGPIRYPEYKGKVPYVPVFNTFIPGVPTGRAELHDMEQLIREKMERITSGSQMIAGATSGDYWQLIGENAPMRVPPSAKPVRGEVATPGAGNRIEAIAPFIAQFQLEQHLGRIDREMAVISGLNDLLLGLAPAQVLSSSKAINALIANYEARLAMRRKLLYAWRRDMWELAESIWAIKDKTVRQIMSAGGGFLEIIDPSLSPRDEMETATRALNLVNGKLMSQSRGMDLVGVDDPEQEQNIIREERTDATLFPADVQVMAQLLAALSQLNLQPSQGVEQQAAGMQARGQADLANALGGATPTNSTSSQLGGDQGVTPPEAIQPGGTQPSNAPFAQGPAAPAAGGKLQGMVQNGKASGRLLTQTDLGRR